MKQFKKVRKDLKILHANKILHNTLVKKTIMFALYFERAHNMQNY